MADSTLPQLAADLAAASSRADRLADMIVGKVAGDVERDAKVKAPVDTGNLRSSITTSRGHLSAEIGPVAEYGGFVEYGTSRMSPQPYLRPAFDRHLPNFEKALERLADL